MPAIQADRGLAPTAEKCRPTVVLRRMTLRTMANAATTQTAKLIPRKRASPQAAIPGGTLDCDHSKRLRETGRDDSAVTFEVSDRLEQLSQQVDPDGVTFTPWLKYTGLRDLPALPDDRPR